ncbi:hypothetical protein KAR34_03835 [bacterium]|nr:hypothetical protein [bacterium]
MKNKLVLYILTGILLTGCVKGSIPQRNVDFKEPKQAVKSYYDYRRLEVAGVETVRLQTRYFNRTVSLAYYLYTIAQAFENFGRENEAKKLYLRLLMNYPVIHEGGQLGVMTENRLYWLLGDKSWVMSSLDELILKLERALQKHDQKALGKLISRDFGFGRNYSERYAVKYKDGLNMLTDELANLRRPTVEIISKAEDERVVLKTTGWENGEKNWFFAIHKNHRLQGWEWDMAYWENANENQ